ncbi:hypothetical protein JRQ81_007601, partial [Phrynocephalus forsythii]
MSYHGSVEPPCGEAVCLQERKVLKLLFRRFVRQKDLHGVADLLGMDVAWVILRQTDCVTVGLTPFQTLSAFLVALGAFLMSDLEHHLPQLCCSGSGVSHKFLLQKCLQQLWNAILLIALILCTGVIMQAQRQSRHNQLDQDSELDLKRHIAQKLSALKTRRYHPGKPPRSWAHEIDSCAICLDRFHKNQCLRVLPCLHEFHRDCVDPWLLLQQTCPLCKHNILGNFPPPTTPEELGARILIQERYEKFGESEEVEMEVESDEEDEKQEKREETPSQLDQDTQVQDMDEGSDEEDENQKAPPPPEAPMPLPLPPTPDQVIVRKDYNPKGASKPLPPTPAPDEYLVSPITGEKIPASKMQEHMRIGLLDPRWLEQRDRSLREKQTDDEVYAPGLDIESSLKQLAERRTDIFGVEETAIGKKIGEEEIQKPEEKQAAQANITLQEQIEVIHKAKELVPEDDSKEKIGPSKPNEMPQPPPPPPSSAPNIPTNAPPIASVPRPPSMPPPVRTAVVSAVPVMPRPPNPMTSVVHLPPGSVIVTPMPPIIHAPRINIVPMPPSAPPIMAPRPPPMIVPT